MKYKLVLISTGFVLLIILILFVGVSRDTEFREPKIFIKHKPSFKINFYSPIGESDQTFNDLNESDKREEKAYQEFVVKNKLDNAIFDLFLLIFGQLSLTTLTLGIFGKNRSKILAIIHYFINVIILFGGIGSMLHFDKMWTVFLIAGIIVSFNIVTIKMIKIKSSAQHAI